MKLLLENWREYLDEAEVDGPEEDKENVGLVQDFLKKLLVITQAAEDSADEALEEGAGRKARMARRSRQERTKQIKQRAGVVGVKIANFTAAERQLYDIAKEEMAKADEAALFVFVKTLAAGDLTKLPLIRNLIQLGGERLRGALAGACPTGALNMTCIMWYLNKQAQESGLT